MKRSLFILLAAMALAAGCGQRSGRSGDAATAKAAADMRDFPTVKIPDVYSETNVRQAYYAEHFWDRFFSEADGMKCDSVTVCGVPATVFEEVFSTYMILLQTAGLEDGRKAAGSLFDKVEARQLKDPRSNAYEVFNRMMEHYLYDPNSPYRNEDIYRPYLEKLAASSLTDPALVPAYQNDARLCALNTVGTPAADFRFTDSAGRTRNLYDIKAGTTLLFFSNPGCNACREIIASIKEIPGITEKISSGRLAILNIYIDEDLKAWRESLPEYPKDWIVGYDPGQSIRRNQLYNVRGIPSLYVLDKDKKVLMKDAPEDRVLALLDTIRSE